MKLAHLSIDRCGELNNNVFNSTIFVVNNARGFPLLMIVCSCPIPRGRRLIFVLRAAVVYSCECTIINKLFRELFSHLSVVASHNV